MESVVGLWLDFPGIEITINTSRWKVISARGANTRTVILCVFGSFTLEIEISFHGVEALVHLR